MAEGIAQSWVSTGAGKHLARRKKLGTAPEMALRRAVHARGLRYRVNVALSKSCRPDLLFRRGKVAVFVDGCFWHGCPRHGRSTFSGPNRALWEAKLRRNRRSDDHADLAARQLGFAVVRIWECEVRLALAAALERIEVAVSGINQRGTHAT